MQFELFNVEELAREKRQGEETFLCRGCNEHLTEFHFGNFALKQFRKKKGENQTQGAGNAVWCKSCQKDYSKGKREAIRNAPPRPTTITPCHCCSVPVKPEDIHLDHDHDTLEFRGWLCRRCNGGLGQLGDNIEGVQKALNYLKGVYDK